MEKHVLRKDSNNWARKVMNRGNQTVRKAKKNVDFLVEEDMRDKDLIREDADDGEKWRRL